MSRNGKLQMPSDDAVVRPSPRSAHVERRHDSLPCGLSGTQITQNEFCNGRGHYLRQHDLCLNGDALVFRSAAQRGLSPMVLIPKLRLSFSEGVRVYVRDLADSGKEFPRMACYLLE